MEQTNISLIHILRAAGLDEREERRLAAYLEEAIAENILASCLNQLDNETAQCLNKMIDEGKDAGEIMNFIKSKIPDLATLVRDQVEKVSSNFKRFIVEEE